MWIKICGNTSLEDARLAVDLGADALGFIFAPSRRQVTVSQVAAITPHLPPTVERVGVFQSHTSAEIVTAVQLAGLSAVQLHATPGDQNALRLAREVHKALSDRVSIIQVLHCDALAPQPGSPSVNPSLQQQVTALATLPAIQRVLVDSRVGSASGGTGIPFDWAAARPILSAIPADLQLILAGGLDPENVEIAIRTLEPWGVDVVTGVESSPGRKDAKKLAAFLRHARASSIR